MFNDIVATVNALFSSFLGPQCLYFPKVKDHSVYKARSCLADIRKAKASKVASEIDNFIVFEFKVTTF